MELLGRNFPVGGWGFHAGITFLGGIFRKEKEFFTKREPDFLVLLKNDQKLNNKHVFSSESKEQYQNLNKKKLLHK